MSELAYKVLGDKQQSHHGGTGTWRKGQWRTVTGDLIPCENGLHYCNRDQLVHWLGPTIWLFEDGTPAEALDAGNKMVTRKGRVVGRVETWNETTARLFAADVAEAALVYIPESHRDPFVAAINAARGYARGEVSAAASYAASAAAWSAASAAASSAASYAASAAASSAASSAASAAASDAASSAAWAAASDAASYAASDAAWSAASDAAWAAHTALLFDYLEGRKVA